MSEAKEQSYSLYAIYNIYNDNTKLDQSQYHAFIK